MNRPKGGVVPLIVAAVVAVIIVAGKVVGVI